MIISTIRTSREKKISQIKLLVHVKLLTCRDKSNICFFFKITSSCQIKLHVNSNSKLNNSKFLDKIKKTSNLNVILLKLTLFIHISIRSFYSSSK